MAGIITRMARFIVRPPARPLAAIAGAAPRLVAGRFAGLLRGRSPQNLLGAARSLLVSGQPPLGAAGSLFGMGNLDRVLNFLRAGKGAQQIAKQPPGAVRSSPSVKKARDDVKKANADLDKSPPATFKRGESQEPAKAPGGPPADMPGEAKKAYEALPPREQRRYDATAEGLSAEARAQLAALLAGGKLVDEDDEGLSLLEKLYGASRLPLHPLARDEGVTNQLLVERLVDDLANPSRIRQATDAGCVWANVKQDIAATRPHDYVDLAVALYTQGSIDVPGLEEPITLDGIPDDQLLADSTSQGVELGSLHEIFPARRVLGVEDATDAAEAMTELRAGLARGDETPVVVDNGDGTAHMITIKALTGDEVTFFDPLAPGKLETIEASRLSDSLAAVLPLRRFRVKGRLRDIAPGGGKKVAGGRFWRQWSRG